jgi:peptidyl-prolyl cis-trans isomerase C
MKLLPVLFLLASAAWAQTVTASPADFEALPDNTVLATIAGKKFTMGDLRKIFAVLPPQNQQGALRDRRGFVQQLALMEKLAEVAEKNKLDQESPTREALAYNRMFILSNAQISKVTQTVEIPEGAHERYYQANQAKYRQVRLKAIYIPFSAQSIAGRKMLAEPEAKAKAESIAAELRAGGDFAKLARLHSEDETSKKKDGDFGTIRQSDNLPDAIRTAIFALKQGEVSQPVRQPNGYYIFRAEEVSAQPLSQVKAEIDAHLRDQSSRAWLDNVVNSLGIKFENEAFFGPGPAAPPAAAAPLKK